MSKRFFLLILTILALTPQTPRASAFCGFYVSGADAELFNEASVVVLMRDGQRTVVSMQNDYQGPPSEFALVVPVPAVLQEDQVKTLPREIFSRLDRLAAPRLVEYWEQDPCTPQYEYDMPMASVAQAPMAELADESADLGVTVEAQFSVGEYDVVVLGAEDSSGLDTWLRQENYRIPEGAEPILRPYVAGGMKFFVAKVDPQRVTFEAGRAVLSPLRFHYDSPEFSLPIRLGTLNSRGEQHVIVHILAASRYEAANYPNVTIPTNQVVPHDTRDNFASFYRGLFDQALGAQPNAVVTEYAWNAMSCDPCPDPPLEQSELMTLGGDVVQNQGFTLTRLHAKVSANTHGEDLVFREAPGLVGGVGTPDAQGQLSVPTQVIPHNNSSFQGRYAMLHPWEGEVECDSPARGNWGGPPSGAAPPVLTAIAMPSGAAEASVGGGVSNGGSGGVSTGGGGRASGPVTVAPGQGGCASCTVSSGTDVLPGVLSVLGLGLFIFVRRR